MGRSSPEILEIIEPQQVYQIHDDTDDAAQRQKQDPRNQHVVVRIIGRTDHVKEQEQHTVQTARQEQHGNDARVPYQRMVEQQVTLYFLEKIHQKKRLVDWEMSRKHDREMPLSKQDF